MTLKVFFGQGSQLSRRTIREHDKQNLLHFLAVLLNWRRGRIVSFFRRQLARVFPGGGGEAYFVSSDPPLSMNILCQFERGLVHIISH
jgi:hypothetical protein